MTSTTYPTDIGFNFGGRGKSRAFSFFGAAITTISNLRTQNWLGSGTAVDVLSGSATTAERLQKLVWVVNGRESRIEFPVGNLSDAVGVQVGAPQLLDEIKERLALSVTQIAEMFGVTRKTVYDWYEGAEPRTSMLQRIETIVDVIHLGGIKGDLARIKFVWNIPLSGKTLLSVLNDDSLDRISLRTSLIEKLNELALFLSTPSSQTKEPSVFLGDAHLAEFDRRSGF